MHIYNDYDGMHMPIANDELMRWSVNPQHEIHFRIHRQKKSVCVRVQILIIGRTCAKHECFRINI